MQLKSDNEISQLVNGVRGNVGFAAATDDSSTVTAAVRLCCAPLATIYASVSAIPWSVLFLIAKQLLPILFPDGGGETLEALQAIIQLIASIFA